MLQKKICLLGASGVGKTSLIKQYVEGVFSEKYQTSIGVKIDKKVVSFEANTVQLIIWDLEGIDRYCGFQPKYLRGASAFAIVTDQTRSQSFTDGLAILNDIRKVTDVPGVLVVNKSDLDPARDVTEKHMNALTEQCSLCFHTSAKTGVQVEELFVGLARLASESQ